MSKVKSKKFTINYMLGDSDGKLFEEATISVNNPFLKIVDGALRKLAPKKGHWGLQLNEEIFESNYKRRNISKMEYDLLCLVRAEDDVSNFCSKYKYEDEEMVENWLMEFDGVFRDETESSFLTYQGHKIK